MFAVAMGGSGAYESSGTRPAIPRSESLTVEKEPAGSYQKSARIARTDKEPHVFGEPPPRHHRHEEDKDRVASIETAKQGRARGTRLRPGRGAARRETPSHASVTGEILFVSNNHLVVTVCESSIRF
jgi:hypothetical protein